ncbi:MAG: alpha-amylase family glycosyl hydrolase [bacterium]
MKGKKLFFALLFLMITFTKLFSQDFMMQGWYWDYPKDGCNSYTGANWANVLNGKVSELSAAGFTYIWLPPLSQASYGECSNGYDPKDLYDLGDASRTGFGTRAEVNQLISSFNSATPQLKAVADVVYNHRDGGVAEDNPAVKRYILDYQTPPKSPYPSDRYRIVIELGGSSPFGAGDYYFKISSKSLGYSGVGYKVYITTVLKSNAPYAGSVSETENNGGCDCTDQCGTSDDIILNQDMNATLGDDGTGCHTDEFHLNLTSSDFTAGGDKLIIYLNNTGSTYSDHRIYGFYYDPEGPTAGTDYIPLITSQFKYQTYTNFTAMPSGQGGMNYENFKPNSGNASSTFLGGDWDWPWFFYDYDQTDDTTQTVLFDWTKWLWNTVGIRGLRMDAVKHFPPEFVGDLLDNLHTNSIDPGLVVGEFYDANTATLKNWITDVYSYMDAPTIANITPRVFDFSLREALESACDDFGYDARNIFTSSLVDAQSMNGYNVVTFINNHDFRDAGQPVDNDPILAYAYILTNNQVGLPCVFYPDYYSVTGFPDGGLKNQIDALISVHKQFIVGATSRDYLSRNGTPYSPSFTGGSEPEKTTVIYQLMGTTSGKDVIVAINFAGVALDCWIGVSTATTPEGTTFGDKIGNATLSTLTVSGGRVHIQLPARSYSVWVEGETPVPVELVSFIGKVVDDKVILNWQTATEVNNYGFEVERSVILSGAKNLLTRNWQNIGFIGGSGSSNSTKEYSFIDKDIASGSYSYRLKQIDTDGSFNYSKEIEISCNSHPSTFELYQNYPNPFNPTTTIKYSIPAGVGASYPDKSGQVMTSLRIYDVLGNEVATLINEMKSSGIYEIEFDASSLTTGIYFYILRCGNFMSVKKMAVLK